MLCIPRAILLNQGIKGSAYKMYDWSQIPFDAFVGCSHWDKLIADSDCAIIEALGVRWWIAAFLSRHALRAREPYSLVPRIARRSGSLSIDYGAANDRRLRLRRSGR